MLDISDLIYVLNYEQTNTVFDPDGCMLVRSDLGSGLAAMAGAQSGERFQRNGVAALVAARWPQIAVPLPRCRCWLFQYVRRGRSTLLHGSRLRRGTPDQ